MTTTDRRKQAEELFQVAADLPPDERPGYLEASCGEDVRLYREVASLLRAYDGDTKDLAALPPAPLGRNRDRNRNRDRDGDEAREAAGEHPGDTIGPYRLLRLLGEGGMGVVYLAEQTKPVHRHVALKILKPGSRRAEVLHRFEMERQLLGSLNHGCIARLYDGGQTPDDRPYFVMEYVEGLELDAYCDANRLAICERLQLFRRVCAAVHYAHRNLVVHGDLKPSNILVTAGGEPKLLDFGIAKLLNPGMSLTNDAAGPKSFVLTPRYASPEQARGDPITTSSDIYSLGVLLYEILSGHVPYRVSSRKSLDIARVICEEDPEKPSTAISRTDEHEERDGGTTRITPESVSRARSGGADRLRRMLTGDVDAIVLMAMRKGPPARYTSAEQLSEDIERHLDGLPVLARTDSFGYRSSKFVGRHRVGVIAATAIVTLLFTGIVGTTAGWRQAEDERRRVLAHREQLIEMSHALMVDFHDEIKELDGALPARHLLISTAREHLEALSAWTEDDPSLRDELATAHDRMGDIHGGFRDPSRGQIGPALEHYEEALAIRRALAAERPDDPTIRRGIASSLENVGDVRWYAQDVHGALDAYREALAIRRQLAAEAHEDDGRARDLAVALRNVGKAHVAMGNAGEAQSYYRESVALREALVARHPDDRGLQRDLSGLYLSLGGRLRDAGDHLGALVKFQRGLTIRERLAAGDPDNGRARRDVAVVQYLIGETLLETGRADEASEYAQAYLVATERRSELNPDSARAQRDVAVAYDLLGQIDLARGEPAAAIERFRAFQRLILTVSNRNAQYEKLLAVSLHRLAVAYEATGEDALAREAAAEAIAIIDRLADADPSDARMQEERHRIRATVERLAAEGGGG